MRTRLSLLASLAALTPVMGQEESAALVPGTEPAVTTDVVPASGSVATAAPSAMDPASVSSGIPMIAPYEPVAPVASMGKDTLSVDFPDEEIRTILRNVADLFELNLVIPDTLQGRTSLKLREVTWRQIFQVILSPIGYTFVEDGNIIKIVSQAALAEEPLTTEIFIINYAKAEDIRKSIESIVDAAVGGKVIVDARSNGLVITERPSRLGRIRPIVEKLDKATEQVMIESKFVEVTDRDIKNIGVNWSSLSGYNVSAGPFTHEYDRASDRDRTRERSNLNNDVDFMNAGYERADALANRNRLVPEYSPNSGIGPEYSIDAATGAVSYSNIGPSSLDSLVKATTVSQVTSAVFDAAQLNVVLSALKTNNDVKLVSNPTVVTLNNIEATINIGEQYPIPSYTYNSERGAFEVSGFEYKDIGVNLKVTPQVNGQGFIRLTVEPEVSVRNGETSFGGASGANIPIIATRKTKTQVSMKDGFTLGIGGLIENNSQKGGTKVPILGDIPIIGRLFSSKSHDISTRNLLIFITAKTLNAEGAAPGEVFDPRAIRAMGLRKDELPGFRDGSDPFPEPAPEPEKKSWFGSKKTTGAAQK